MTTMLAARLHGPKDLRIERVPLPGPPAAGEVLLRIRAVGVCGSDLHLYSEGRIGNTPVGSPLVLGHEFCGIVEAAGMKAIDGEGAPLKPGSRVVVDPLQPCYECDLCREGLFNICRQQRFCGLSPTDGALQQYMRVPARTCFSLPDSLDFAESALLETLGVALHSVDLAHVARGRSAALLGAGPIGLCILQLLRLSEVDPGYVAEPLPWRAQLARQFGGIPVGAGESAIAAVREATAGRGTDLAIEAAWSGPAVQQAAEMIRPGGRLTLVGIPADDDLRLHHSTARRKALTIVMVRRMLRALPRAIALAARGAVRLAPLITHRFTLERAAEAYALNAAYRDGIVKAVVEL